MSLRKRAEAGMAEESQSQPQAQRRRRITSAPPRTIAIPSALEEVPPPPEQKPPAPEIAIHEQSTSEFAYQVEPDEDRASMLGSLDALLHTVPTAEEYAQPSLEEATRAEVELIRTLREKGGSREKVVHSQPCKHLDHS